MTVRLLVRPESSQQLRPSLNQSTPLVIVTHMRRRWGAGHSWLRLFAAALSRASPRFEANQGPKGTSVACFNSIKFKIIAPSVAMGILAADIRAIYLRDMRKRAADLADDLDAAVKLQQHTIQS